MLRGQTRRGGRRATGSALIVTMGLMVVVSMVAAAMLTYTGEEFGRARRVTRAITARECAESGLQWGRIFYGSKPTSWWNQALAGTAVDASGHPYNQPDFMSLDWTSPVSLYVAKDVAGRIDGHAVGAGYPPDFIVTIRDNPDEFPVPNPNRDNDLLIILRSECVRPGTRLPKEGSSVNSMPATITDAKFGPLRDDDILEKRRGVVLEALLASTDWSGYHNRGTDSPN